MNIIDILLRSASMAILLFMVHQFLTKGGSGRHIFSGKIIMFLGAVIVILVAIRGAQQETMSFLYSIHLITGGPFFLMLFATGYFGYKSRQSAKFIFYHKSSAVTTAVLLIITLCVGIWSRLSH